MEVQNLGQLIKKYWQKKFLESWKMLFDCSKEDCNIYYIQSWHVLLEKNSIPVVSLWSWEILWEKSFLELVPKLLDAKVSEDLEYYFLTKEKFDQLNEDAKVSILSWIWSFLTNRIYKLNDVLTKINYYNSNIILSDIDDEKLKNIFKNDITIEEILVLKKINWNENFHKLYWNIVFWDDVEKLLYTISSQDNKIKVWKNYLIFDSWSYVFLFFGKIISEKYILENSILYSTWMFDYLWFKLEEKQNNEFLESSDSFDE